MTLTKPVSPAKANAYAGRPIAAKDNAFVTTATIGGKNSFISDNGNILGQADTAVYYRSGPNFDIQITMPSAAFTTHEGIPMFDYRLKIVMDLYDNLGQYINTYNLDIPKEKFSAIRELVDNGILKLNVEWAAKDNEAPVAKKGNKIGTGAYIAKFDLTAETYCATTFEASSNDYKLACKTVGERKEKATDSKTKTLGFKRKK